MMQPVMKRAVLAALLCGVASGALVAPQGVFAAPQSEKGTRKSQARPATVSKSAPAPKTEVLEGTVTKMKTKGMWGPGFTVRSPGKGERSIAIDPKKTTIRRQGQGIGWTQLQVGDQVKVRYSKTGMRKTARSVDVTGPAISSAASAPKSSPAAAKTPGTGAR